MEQNKLDTSADPKEPFKFAVASFLSSLNGIEADKIVSLVEVPEVLTHGDLTICVSKLNRFAKLGQKPDVVATEWAQKFQPNEFLTAASASGQFINFTVNGPQLVKTVVQYITKCGPEFGSHKVGEGKRAIVEYSSPNIAKPFHAGHLRSTIIGNFLKHLHRKMGFNVTSINYLGDWGKQYGLLAVGFKRYGSEEELLRDPIRHLFDVYVKINKDAEKDKEKQDAGEEVNEPTHDLARQYFKRMEDGDEEALKLWTRFRDLSIEKYKEIYGRLNVEFDVYSGESQVSKEMQDAYEHLRNANLLVENDKAQLIDLEKFKLGKAIVQKKDGATLYITRDIGEAKRRYDKFHFDRLLYVVAAQQDHHFKQLFKILELMGYTWSKNCVHINFGLVKGAKDKDGKVSTFKTREGNVVFLEDTLNDCRDHMLEIMKKNQEKFKEIENPLETADIVGMSAVIIQDFSANRIKDYVFDLDQMTNENGDTGPYLQYSHARLCGIIRKSGFEVNPNADLLLVNEKIAKELSTHLSQYPAAIKDAFQSLEACRLVTYLMKLSHLISRAHAELKVKGSEKSLAEARLLVFNAALTVLNDGLKMLGLKPLERM